MNISLFAVVVGFLLPWQTRFLLRAPSVNGVVWDFGIISIFVAQGAIALWLLIEAWQHRVAVRMWLQQWDARKKIIVGTFAAFIALQLLFSADRLLTVQWLMSVALLAGLAVVLHSNPRDRIPFAAAFLISIVFQSLLAAMQVSAGATFASSLLGVAAHKASVAGTAVIEYAGNRYLRAYGGQPHPNIFGGLTLVGLLLFGWILKNKKTLGVRKNIIQFSLVVTGALFFTFSRAAWIGFVIWLVALWRKRTQLRESQITQFKWMLGAFGVLLLIFFPMVLSRASPSTAIEQRSITERGTDIARWKTVAREHWMVGTGVGAYTAALGDAGEDRRVPVHSVPLLAFAEIGLIGGILMILALWAARIRRIPVLMLLILAPILLFDHYLWSLWSGQVILFVFLFQMLEIGNNDEADNHEQRPGGDFSKTN